MQINSLETFRNRIAAGGTALGCVITLNDSTVAELAADAGFDFIWIDMEHSPMTIGPFDLSSSYGKTGQFDDPEIVAAIDTVREKALKAGVLLGGYCARRPFWAGRKMNWKALTTDAEALFRDFGARLADERAR